MRKITLSPLLCGGARETHWATCHYLATPSKTKEFHKSSCFLYLNSSSFTSKIFSLRSDKKTAVSKKSVIFKLYHFIWINLCIRSPLFNTKTYLFKPFSKNFQAHLVSGVYEQTFVADIQEFALCVGRYENEDHCNEESSSAVKSVFLALFLAIFGLLL